MIQCTGNFESVASDLSSQGALINTMYEWPNSAHKTLPLRLQISALGVGWEF